MNDYRQRFFLQDTPIRGDLVQLHDTFLRIIRQKNYPTALQALLGQMAVGASLLMSTLKIQGRLSIQLQASGDTPLLWAMAECDHLGGVRALASFLPDGWENLHSADDAFLQLGDGVLFINIHQDAIGQKAAESYQGIVEKVSNNLADCLAHYQKQSAQIPTWIKLTTNANCAAGIVLQKLPSDEMFDEDAWGRMQILTQTLTDAELTDLPADEILYRLYHEEQIALPDAVPLTFSCTCSKQKSENAIINLGKQEATQAVAQTGELALDCGFCGTVYRFNPDEVAQLFA